MFCGRPAFSADTPLALLPKHVSETPTPPRDLDADIPVRIDEAILKCLEKNPDRRFQSALDLDAALSLGTSAESIAEDVAAPELPSHLLRWQRIDWAIVAAAAVGLVIFFVCFGRVSLAPRSQVTFDRAVLRRIAGEHLERLGVSAPVRQVGGGIDPGQYVYVATTYGATFAREAANNPVHYWTWSTEFDGGSLNVDNRGRLTSFARRRLALDSTSPSLDDARRQAARAVEDFFGQTTATLALEHEAGGQVYEFAWLGPADKRPRMRYTVDIDKAGVSSLASGPVLPSGYSRESFPFGEVTMNEWGIPVAIIVSLFLCAFGFVNRRRVEPSTSWRSALPEKRLSSPRRSVRVIAEGFDSLLDHRVSRHDGGGAPPAICCSSSSIQCATSESVLYIVPSTARHTITPMRFSTGRNTNSSISSAPVERSVEPGCDTLPRHATT
jgi:hypothetical protein